VCVCICVCVCVCVCFKRVCVSLCMCVCFKGDHGIDFHKNFVKNDFWDNGCIWSSNVSTLSNAFLKSINTW